MRAPSLRTTSIAYFAAAALALTGGCSTTNGPGYDSADDGLAPQSDTGEDGTDPGTEPGGGTDETPGGGGSGGETQGDPTNSGCASDRVAAPGDALCDCSYSDCEATQINCACDLTCYGAADCAVNCSGPDCTTSDGTLGGCGAMSCVEENDYSEQLECSFSECEVQPNVMQIAPDVAPAAAAAELERAVRSAGILTLIDPSGSMEDEQKRLACAVDAFLNVTDSAGADFNMGVTVMNPQKLYDGSANMIPDAIPDLVGVEGCPYVPSCADGGCGSSAGGSTCQSYFTDDGAPVANTDLNATETLRQLFVQAGNREEGNFGSGVGDDESGLEYAFRYVMYLVSQGLGDQIGQVVAVSDETADGDGQSCKIQEKRYDPTNMSIMRAALGDDFNPPANTGNCATDLKAFYIYFFSRYNIQVNVLVRLDSSTAYDAIYIDTAKATGGAIGDIHDCSTYDQFWQDVGTSTATLSTQMCLPEPIDPGTLGLTYTEGGQAVTVPRSTTDGWSYDATLNCIVLNGSWADKYGSFSADYDSLGGTTVSQTCFPPGVDPLVDSLVVSYQGTVIPQSSQDGWTFDPATDCFTFHGSWANVEGPFDIEYL